MVQAVAGATQGNLVPPGNLVPAMTSDGTSDNLMPPHGNLVPPGQSTALSAEAQHGNQAGDGMPLEWRDMPCVDVWRGMGKGQLRPAIDIQKTKKMLEKRNRNPEKRFSDDKQANNGIPTFLLNEYKQNATGPPLPPYGRMGKIGFGHQFCHQH